ncbi:helix-turn-helix domain-containing protein (plasmid) [Cytobacillus pseudoceanisediminis]|uniref:helix-turn-helix domain-containing protein n=1 Tax=Cytobacillus pseudoceanisediminis TaxID=3051614 RepID=UPI0021893E8E|nr:helix-turn-helix transcriptional regulator [Cytobacillus pseudoceanisediminis]UQX57056.1 helix-turn-helix domain-containing protein [Cytobacillus pseudoceanisediminis]
MLEKFTFGQQIKYVRTIKKINQNELAKGICSISYLSKIENGVIYPSEEIKNLLIKKLGIEDSTLNNEFGEREIQGFYNFLLNKDIQNAEKVYKELLNKDFSEALNLRFEVISIFYFVERKQFKELPN